MSEGSLCRLATFSYHHRRRDSAFCAEPGVFPGIFNRFRLFKCAFEGAFSVAFSCPLQLVVR